MCYFTSVRTQNNVWTLRRFIHVAGLRGPKCGSARSENNTDALVRDGLLDRRTGRDGCGLMYHISQHSAAAGGSWQSVSGGPGSCHKMCTTTLGRPAD